MKKLLALAAAMLLGMAPAQAQEVPEQARRDLWCGIAFGIVSADASAAASGDDKAIVERLADGSAMLLERAFAAHLALGYSEAAFAARKAEQEALVAAALSDAGHDHDYSYEDCRTLIDP